MRRYTREACLDCGDIQPAQEPHSNAVMLAYMLSYLVSNHTIEKVVAIQACSKGAAQLCEGFFLGFAT